MEIKFWLNGRKVQTEIKADTLLLDLLREKKILIVQGSGFNWHQPDHFRIVYLPRIEVLKEASEKLKDFFSYYHQ